MEAIISSGGGQPDEEIDEEHDVEEEGDEMEDEDHDDDDYDGQEGDPKNESLVIGYKGSAEDENLDGVEPSGINGEDEEEEGDQAEDDEMEDYEGGALEGEDYDRQLVNAGATGMMRGAAAHGFNNFQGHHQDSRASAISTNIHHQQFSTNF